MASRFEHSFQNRFRTFRLDALLTPRKPRNPLLRIGFGLLGVALLAVLLVVGLFVGAAMLLFGLIRTLMNKPAVRPAAVDASVVEGEYRVEPAKSTRAPRQPASQPLLR